MEPYFKSLFGQFQELHGEIRKAIAGLPSQALAWKPGHEMNSISVLVVHICGAERYWVGDVVLGEPSNRVREAEFEVNGQTHQQLNQRLDAADDYLREAFDQLRLNDLESERVSPRNNKKFLAGWALDHTLEHTALHLGHMQIMRQLWQQQYGGESHSELL